MIAHFEYDRRYFPPASVIEIAVDGYVPEIEPVVLRAMIDSGADGTMIPTRVLEAI